jgi:uncharacterized protein with von Willebrand factor type A (vWA) domain
MLSDLNELLDKHRRGEDTDADFDDFMAKHGDFFPENPRTVEELIDALAQRAAAAQRLLNSMTAEQRAELMQLSAQAFGSPALMAQLGQLDANLQALRPGEDWSGSSVPRQRRGLGLGDGTGVLQDLAELDALAEQLGRTTPGARRGRPRPRRPRPPARARTRGLARTLAELERPCATAATCGAAPTARCGCPRAMRRLGKTLLADAGARLSARRAQRDTRLAGAAGEQTGATRPWQFGDTEPWDVTRTLTNAILRTVAEGTDPRDGSASTCATSR